MRGNKTNLVKPRQNDFPETLDICTISMAPQVETELQVVYMQQA